MKESKVCESAYQVVNHPRMGPQVHGAGMLERSSGVTHVWLVRGPCTQSVVAELQRQLSQAYEMRDLEDRLRNQPRISDGLVDLEEVVDPAPPAQRNSAGRLWTGLLLAGLFTFFAAFSACRR